MLRQKIAVVIGIGIIIFLGFWIIHTEKNQTKMFRLGLDLSGGSHLVYRANVDALPPQQITDSLGVLRDVIEQRVNSLGVSEAKVTNEVSTITGSREYRLTVDLPGVHDIETALAIIGKTPVLEFKVENPDFVFDQTDPSAITDLSELYIDSGLSGKFLETANVQFDPITAQPIVGIQFNAEGAKLFEEITGSNIGKTIAIYLDGSIISAPMVNEAITGGQAVISGVFTPVEARELVARLNSGALPVPIELISTETIGPTLGVDALRAGSLAGIIGIAGIILSLILWYRLPGLIASILLLLYSIVMFTLFKYIPVTLSSAGIAGFIISLGMAVDANILVFERMKEEIKSGKNLYESIEIGFDRAWTSIRDGNISSIITAIVLFILGTTLMKGFAITFGLGVLISMITAITLSRILLKIIAGKQNPGRIKKWLFLSGFSK